MNLTNLLKLLRGPAGTVTKPVGGRAVARQMPRILTENDTALAATALKPRTMPKLLDDKDMAMTSSALTYRPSAPTLKAQAKTAALRAVLLAYAAEQIKTATIQKAAARIIHGDVGLDAVVGAMKKAAKKRLTSKNG